MFARRKTRVHPLKDDKVLTDWNGLMIAAFAVGARILDKPEYAAVAGKAFGFIERNLMTADGALLHRYRDGEAGIAAQADDYAFVVWGLLELYRTTFDPAHLERAVCLQKRMLDDFWDTPKGGFFLTAETEKDLPVRPKELYDGAVPSANSVSLTNLTMLFRLTGDARWAECADLLSRAFSGSVKANPSGFTYFLTGAAMAVSPGREIVGGGRARVGGHPGDACDIEPDLCTPPDRALQEPGACCPAGTGGRVHRGALTWWTAGQRPMSAPKAPAAGR